MENIRKGVNELIVHMHITRKSTLNCMGCFIKKKKMHSCYIYLPLDLEYWDMAYIQNSPVTATIFETLSDRTHQYEHLDNEPKLS